MKCPESSGTVAVTTTSRDLHNDHLVEVVIPVYNEERVLADSVRRLHAYLLGNFPYQFRITIADNASSDATGDIARWLVRELPYVQAVHLPRKGRGRALRQVWSGSDADVVAYMDVDLSTDLDAFLPLVAPLVSGHSDLAIGSRLSRGAVVVRGPKRELISRCYNLLLRGVLRARFSDAQCGFKAGRTEIMQALLPEVKDEEWFFDTELLVLAERSGLRIHEVPVDWVDDPDSRVKIIRTVWADLRGVVRMAGRLVSGAARISVPRRSRIAQPKPGLVGQLPSFAVIGAACTLAYFGLYLGLRMEMSAMLANAGALLITAVANTAANRRFTFGVIGSHNLVRHQFEGGIAFLVGLAISSASLAVLHANTPAASRPMELAVLIGANVLAAIVRFALMRAWVFNPRRVAAI
ncbi:MAG: glycosyltransferase [Candidatus Dormibacteraceae bacterium]